MKLKYIPVIGACCMLSLNVFADPSTSGGLVSIQNHTLQHISATTTQIGKSGAAFPMSEGLAVLHGGGSTLDSSVTIMDGSDKPQTICSIYVSFNSKSFDHIFDAFGASSFAKQQLDPNTMQWQLVDPGTTKSWSDLVTVTNVANSNNLICTLTDVAGAVGNGNNRMLVHPTIYITKTGSAADQKLSATKLQNASSF
jgi:hypothetical protein